ncbi:MAG: hypothetical protein ACFNTA_02700, partial [Campylobacter sp.]|uniref:hypothetical protein n=1 Tax=Campylobacter sp. TaxID=205 RepID=UPI0036145799
SPQDEVYAGQIVGEHIHEKDLVINVTKAKHFFVRRGSGERGEGADWPSVTEAD